MFGQLCHVSGMDAFHIDVWTDEKQANGELEYQAYAVMAETREKALALAKAELPSTWRIEAPEGWQAYGPSVIYDYDLKPGHVRRIS
jgi:hypothetical protein